MKLLKEEFIQDKVVQYLETLGYDKNQNTKELWEHGVDIKVRHRGFSRYWLIEVKGDPGKNVKSPGGSRSSSLNSAVGQIVSRMHTNRKDRNYKYGYKYGVAFPESFREMVLRKIPYDVCFKLNIYLFFVNALGQVDMYDWKKVKVLQVKK